MNRTVRLYAVCTIVPVLCMSFAAAARSGPRHQQVSDDWCQKNPHHQRCQQRYHRDSNPPWSNLAHAERQGRGGGYLDLSR
jgi:hypothetical protein